jgi:hypothetical protein
MEVLDYDAMVNNFYLIDYKWVDNMSINKPNIKNNKFMKYCDASKKLEIIEIDVMYPHFKIINFTVYLLPLFNPAVYENTTINGYLNNNQKVIKYINDITMHDKLSKFSIKIIENDKIFTITDEKYNIYKITDYIY